MTDFVSFAHITRIPFRLLVRHFPLWMRILAPAILATLALSIFALFVSFGPYETYMSIALTLVLFFLYAFVTLALIFAGSSLLEEKKTTARAAYAKTCHLFGSYLLVVLVTMLCLGALLAVWMIPTNFLFAMAQNAVPMLRVILATVTTVFLFPFLLVAVWFSFGTYIVALEHKGVFAALEKSRRLASPFFGSICSRIAWIVVVYIVFVLVSLLLLVTVISLVIGTGWSGGFVHPEPWWVTLLGQILPIMLLPYFHMAMLLLYTRLAQGKREK